MTEQQYIVLAGSLPIVDAWRRERDLPMRAVIAVTPATATRALLGLTGDFEVITHETWPAFTEASYQVRRQLAIIEMSRTIHT